MGMFDSFFFEDGVLPDNKNPASLEFQTKDLDCELYNYFVSADGSVIKLSLEGDEDKTPINITAEVYSINKPNEPHIITKCQHYKIVIVNSRLVHAEKTYEEGYDQPVALKENYLLEAEMHFDTIQVLKAENKRLRDFTEWLEAGIAGMFDSWEDMQTQIEERLLALKDGGR